MGIEQNRGRIAARVRQALQQSAVDLSNLAPSQEERLVNTITDGVLLEFDSILSDAMPAQAAASAAISAEPLPGSAARSDATDPQASASADAAAERVLWEGRPFLSIGEYYVVTSDRIRFFTGLIGRQVENIELVRLQDVDYHQGVSERIFGVGDIYLRSAHVSAPNMTLRNVKDPEAVTSIIRRAWLEARKKYGVQFRDEM